MSERRDYILGMVEHMARMVVRARELIGRGELTAARDELRRVVRQAGLDLDMVKRVSAETLISILSSSSTPDAARCLLVAEVLAAEADRVGASNRREDVDGLRTKAVSLYCATRPHLSREDQKLVDRCVADLNQRASERASAAQALKPSKS